MILFLMMFPMFVYFSECVHGRVIGDESTI